MVTNAPPADAEVGLMIHLSDLAPAVTAIPTDWKARIVDKGALLRVRRIGGGLSPKGDEPRLSVYVFTLLDSTKPRSSHKLAGQVTSRVLALNEAPVITIPVELGGEDDGSSKVRFDGGTLESGPVQIPWADEDTVLVECIYRVSTRR